MGAALWGRANALSTRLADTFCATVRGWYAVWGSKRVTVRTSIRMTLLGVLLAVVSTALIAHEFIRRDDMQSSCGQSALIFAQGTAQQFRAEEISSKKDLDLACRRLLDFPWVLAVSVQDASGNATAMAAIGDGLDELLDSKQASDSPTVQHLVLPKGLATRRGAAQLVCAPLQGRLVGKGPARLCVLTQMEPVVCNAWQHVKFFVLPVCGVSILTLSLGAWWLWRDVIQPIGSLVEVADTAIEEDKVIDPLPRHRDLGRIARGLSSLRENLTNSRQREHTIERRTDSRVARETRRISQDLRRMQRTVWKDGLTGIHNRRFLEERFPAIFDAQRDSGSDLSVIMFDLDNFKILNDTSGHAAGDAILQFVGDLLKHAVRPDDFAVRYGGDEFALILPGIPTREAQPIAERICAMFAQRAKMMVEVKTPPAMTAGIAGLIQHQPANSTQLVALADKALLAAKAAGKGRVHIAQMRKGRPRTHPTAGQKPTPTSTRTAANL